MEYSNYQLRFPVGVHFGSGLLNDSDPTFCADTLFSALYMEALKQNLAVPFLEAVQQDRLRWSDAFPYVENEYLVPKPIMHIEGQKKGDSAEKKKFKKLKYIRIGDLNTFLKGEYEPEDDLFGRLGKYRQQVMAAVRTGEETLPYYVGTYAFYPGNGLYLLCRYADEESRNLFENLLDALHYVGIGGKKTSGLGKFDLYYGKKTVDFDRCFQEKGGRKILISTALPTEDELETALEGASYLLKKRSGFIDSETYAPEERKKKDLYVFAAGSCFHNGFKGAVYDVSTGGNHPVYRYAKPMFLEV